MAEKKCSVEGCNGKHEAKGYCGKHYQRFKKHGNPLITKIKKECSVEDCNNKHYGKGYCKKHYKRFIRYGNIYTIKKKLSADECTVEGCSKKQSAKGYCPKHYQRFKKYGDPLFVKVETHGMTRTNTHNSWTGMKARCLNKKSKDYNDYGGRGITVCDKWLNSFVEFYKDMGDCPNGYSIDRIDVNSNYEPGNCRWVDSKTQAENRRPISSSKSGCKGVTKIKDKFKANITSKRKQYYLNLHNTFEEAVIARLKGELKYWGYIQQTQFEYLLKTK